MFIVHFDSAVQLVHLPRPLKPSNFRAACFDTCSTGGGSYLFSCRDKIIEIDQILTVYNL